MINATTLKRNASGTQGGCSSIDYLLAQELAAEKARQVVGYYNLPAPSEAAGSQFYGGMAKHLGLAEKRATKELMLPLTDGFDPTTKRKLCHNAGDRGQIRVRKDKTGKPLQKDGKDVTYLAGGHRIGYDLTLSAPLDISVAFALASDPAEKEAIHAAHRNAVQRAMEAFEAMSETRRNKAGKDVIGVEGLIWSSHHHYAARADEATGEMGPNLHTHNLLYNISLGSDLQEATLDASEIFRYRKAMDEVYKTELYQGMKALGYEVDRIRELDDEGQETGRVFARIAGLDEEVTDRYGNRRKELLAYAAKHNVSNQQATLATRKDKDEPPYHELIAHWQETLKGFDVSTESLKQAKGNADEMEHRSVAELLERLHDKDAIFCDHNLIELLGQEYAGSVSVPKLYEMVEAFKQDNGLVRVNPMQLHDDDKGDSLARRHTQERYCAPWMLKIEQEVVANAIERAKETHHHVPQAELDRVVEDYEKAKGFKLSKEQRDALEHITRNSGGVVNLSGLAGTGKTTIAECYKAAFESQGFQLQGVCVSNAAAEKLEAESGMSSVSMAQMLYDLDKDKIQFRKADVIVVDEAGMVDARETHKLFWHASKAGAKVIMQGDLEQLQSIGASSGMALTKSAVGDSKLTEIRRQGKQEDRETALSFYARDENGQIIDLKKASRSRAQTLEKGNQLKARLLDNIRETASEKEARDQLLHEYFEAPTPLEEKLVIAHTRADVAALNAGIRAGLKERGQLDRDEVVIEARDKGRKFDLALSKGDQILFTAKDKDLGVINGTRAVVDTIKPSRKGGHDITVSIRSETKADGRRLTFNSHEMKALTHSYAGTVHKSQGQGKREVYHLANLGMLDAHSALVAFTRLTKGSYRMYATSDDVERLNERLGLERLKETVLDAGLVGQKKGEDLHPMQVQSSQRPQHQFVQRPPTQRSGIQGKLDMLVKEHREQRQALAQMSEGERNARKLLEVFEQGGLRVAKPTVPSVIALKPEAKLRNGFVR
ncbi:MobF family relaxase [Xanthomonas arboricola pv. corylina]|uniref:MobF family relaxase n=1 Tax=Xanthomonas arboricola TaxID=56448 RepID=UPI0003A267F7|nr:MobF family relaxase [Xanthomonas arboricola]